jgi:hypothetical protein
VNRVRSYHDATRNSVSGLSSRRRLALDKNSNTKEVLVQLAEQIVKRQVNRR